jgi:hypothetical protein
MSGTRSYTVRDEEPSGRNQPRFSPPPYALIRSQLRVTVLLIVSSIISYRSA